MSKLLSIYIIPFYTLSFLIFSCQFSHEQKEVKQQSEVKVDSIQTQQNQEIVQFVEKLLFAAGNKNVDAMKELIYDKAIVGSTSLNNDIWTTKQWAVDEIYDLYSDDKSMPYLEIVDDYEIIASERMALVKADAIINSFGVPGKREINHITLIKTDSQ